MTEKKNIDQELKEVHEDISTIAEKKPEMMPVLIGIVKGIRLSSEVSEEPKVTD